MASAVAGSNGVGSAVVGLSVDAGSVDTNLIFGTGMLAGGALGDLDVSLEGEWGQLAAFLLRARGRGIVGWWLLMAMVVRTKFLRNFFDGVLLAKKYTNFCKVVHQADLFLSTNKTAHVRTR